MPLFPRYLPAIRRALLAALLLATPALAADALSPAANSAFLAANAAKPGTVTRPSGLQYRVLKTGFGRRPGGGDIVRVSYKVTLIDGRQVDATPPTLPATLAMSGIGLRGLAEALALMHEGDRWLVVIPSPLGFGVKEAGNGAVPPGQTLIFDITLLSATTPQPGEALPENPLSYWSNGREVGGTLTIRP
jgi:FKBP-type peptidyl-prolyl cis-trans isomerase